MHTCTHTQTHTHTPKHPAPTPLPRPQHDIVPRFSIHNVFELKEEMDGTKWGDLVAARVKDWCGGQGRGRPCARSRVCVLGVKRARSSGLGGPASRAA
jgi:hypothetical protein